MLAPDLKRGTAEFVVLALLERTPPWLGALLGIGVGALARSAFFGVQPADPLALVVVVATLAATGIAASLAPAFRAARADPVESLRAE